MFINNRFTGVRDTIVNRNTILATLVSILAVFVMGCSPAAEKKMVANNLASEKIAYLRYTDQFWQVWITDINGSFHKQLTSDAVDKTRISWSKALKRLLVNSNDGKLALLDIMTQQQAPLRLDSLEVFDAQLSPDGKRIVYTATTTLQADNAEVWVANLDGTAKQKITHNTAVTLYPSWSEDGSFVLYSAGAPGKNQELWQAFPDSEQSAQLTISSFSSLDPNANQTGKILYSSDQTGYYTIWMLDERQKKLPITEGKTFDTQPVWHPSGQTFLFFRLANNKKQIWLHNLKSQEEFPITPESVLSRSAVWVN